MGYQPVSRTHIPDQVHVAQNFLTKGCSQVSEIEESTPEHFTLTLRVFAMTSGVSS